MKDQSETRRDFGKLDEQGVSFVSRDERLERDELLDDGEAARAIRMSVRKQGAGHEGSRDLENVGGELAVRDAFGRLAFEECANEYHQSVENGCPSWCGRK